jgi:ketosteroid isomerase-like protein
MSMATRPRLQLVRDIYSAYETGDRGFVEQNLAQDLVFSAPPDVGIDRATYFERCWPASKTITAYQFPRILEASNEVIVTYEATRTQGPRVRNTEIFGFDGDKVSRIEVYFGWNLDDPQLEDTRDTRGVSR